MIELERAIVARSMPVHLEIAPSLDRFYVSMPQIDKIGVYNVITDSWEQPVETPPYPGYMTLLNKKEMLAVASFVDESVLFVDLKTHQTTCLPAARYPRYLAVSPDEESITSINFHVGTVTLITLSSDGPFERETVRVGPRPVSAAFFNTPSRIGVIDQIDPSIYIIDGSLDGRVTKNELESCGRHIVVSPNTNEAYISLSRANGMLVVDSEGRSITTITTEDYPICHGLLSDNKRIFIVNGRHGSVSFIDCESRRLICTVEVDALPITAFEVQDLDILLVIARRADRVTVLSTRDYKVLASLAAGHMGYWIGYSPLTRCAYLTSEGTPSISVLKFS